MKVSSHDPQRFGNERLDFLGELLFLGTVAMTVSSKGWVGSKIPCFYSWTYSLSISLCTLCLCPSQIARMPPRCPPSSVPCQCLEPLPSCKRLSFGTCLLVPLLPPCGDLLPTPSASFCEVSFPPSLPPLRAPGCMWRGAELRPSEMPHTSPFPSISGLRCPRGPQPSPGPSSASECLSPALWLHRPYPLFCFNS